MRRGQRAYTALAVVLCLAFALFLLLAVANLPPYGSDSAPTVNEVAQRYVEKGTEETGAVNTVAGMILDYRSWTMRCWTTIRIPSSARYASW